MSRSPADIQLDEISRQSHDTDLTIRRVAAESAVVRAVQRSLPDEAIVELVALASASPSDDGPAITAWARRYRLDAPCVRAWARAVLDRRRSLCDSVDPRRDITGIVNSKGDSRAARKPRLNEHAEWLVRHQIGESYSDIARSTRWLFASLRGVRHHGNHGRTVSAACHTLADLIGLSLRPPDRGGRPHVGAYGPPI